MFSDIVVEFGVDDCPEFFKMYQNLRSTIYIYVV
jgi:hypothetical protein